MDKDGSYGFEELRSLFLDRADTDEHLTERVSAQALKERVRQAAGFQDLVAVWRWLENPMAGNP